MKKGITRLRQIFSSTTNRAQSTSIDLHLTDERLRLSAEHAGAAFVMVGLVLFGFGFIFYDRIDHWLLFFLPIITGVYLLRVWLAHRFLSHSATTDGQKAWLISFNSLAAIIGVIWGIAIAYLITLGNREIDLFLTFLVGGLTAGAIPTFGVLSSAYILYILGLMMPAAYAVIDRNNDLSTMLGAHCINA